MGGKGEGDVVARASSERIYTVDDVISKMGFGPFQLLITVFCGLIWLTDAMEFMIISVLSPAVKCQWDLSAFEEAMITSVVFFGFFLGGLFWGVVFDILGRKAGLFIVNIIILLFGILSALKISSDDGKFPGYPWLLACRCGVGFGAGGAGQSVTYYAEFLPQQTRGVCIVIGSLWWAIGSMLGAALAIGVMGQGGWGWHWYLGFAASPLGLVLFLYPFVPESARYYLVKGKNDKAQEVIRRVAWINCKAMPHGRLVSQEEKDKLSAEQDAVFYSEETVTILDSTLISSDVASDQEEKHPALETYSGENGSVVEKAPLLGSEEQLDSTPAVEAPSSFHDAFVKLNLIFVNGMWRTTGVLLLLWLGAAWLYYGIVLLTTSLLQYNPHCGVHNQHLSNSTSSCEGNQLDNGDYIKILWTSAAEIPGLLVTVVIIELLGRRLTMAIEFVACMVGFLLLFICTSESLLTFFLFLVRAFTSGVFQAVYVYTPEVYPTNTRAFGMGVCTSAARIGAIVTPYVAQVLLHINDYVTLSLYAGSSLVLAVLAMLLPIETKGRALQDTGT